MKVSVSILGLNDRKKAISLLNNTNCDYIHIDVMDGSFVPNKQFTTEEINNLEIISKKKFDVHLMVDNPREYIENLDISNIEYIIVHSEIDKDINELLDLIKSYNIKCGLSIKPNTDISILTPYLNKLDLILVMSVEPGFSGQEFISNSLDKVSKLKQIIKKSFSFFEKNIASSFFLFIKKRLLKCFSEFNNKFATCSAVNVKVEFIKSPIKL